MGFGADSGSALDDAHAAAARAIALDGGDAMAHAVVSRLLLQIGEHETSISACETALALNPNLAYARFGLDSAFSFSGRHEVGIVELDELSGSAPATPIYGACWP